ncbi:RNA polymerase sigma factor [Capnocytophaga sp. HP1101]
MAMTIDDKTIIATMNECPENGFRLLMNKYKKVLYWHIRRIVVEHEDAQDAVQETFIRAFRSFHTFESKESLTAWVYKIATNEALRLLSRRREVQLSLDSSEGYSNSIMSTNYVDYTDLESVKLQKAIHSLPTKQQLAFNLRYYDELSYDEIAQITNSTVANVKANYHNAKNKIVQYMKTHD